MKETEKGHESLAFQAFGPDNAPTVMFLHGGGVAGWMWKPVVDRMQDFHCLVPDLPEHGKSVDIGPFTMKLAADKAIELVRKEAHGGKATVIGLSEGAQVVVQMLATGPEVIRKAVVSSALLLPMPGYGWLNSPRLLAWMFRLSVPPFRKNEWWMHLNMKYSAAVPEKYFPEYKNNFQIMNENQFVDIILANQHFRMPEKLGKVNVPTLVIAGKREYSVVKESARKLATTLPKGQVKVVNLGKGASMATEHNWAMNAPDFFAKTIRAWIQEKPLPSELEDL